ncbi:MAG: hypothetical protein WCS73_03565 [Lentisphaeria bacterium]
MKAPDAINLLKKNSVFWSRIGFLHDPPLWDKDGKMILFGEDLNHFKKFHHDFTAAGIKIHTSILFNGWIGVDKYDYKFTDQVVNSIFEDHKDIWYIPRIKLNVPLDWGKENPEDIFVYYNGPREKEEIHNLVNTSKHDILGYDSIKGYHAVGDGKGNRPNVGGLISNQSFSSKKWLKDAGEALRRLIRHLEDGPHGEQILAYHIAYGTNGESCLWGGFGLPIKFGDYGINNRKEFYNWGLHKYGTLEKLRVAWMQNLLAEQNCEPPPPALREGCKNSTDDFLRIDKKYQICIDYDQFTNDVNANAIEHFCKIVKEESDNKAAGAFYGYIFEVPRAAYIGHLNFDQLLHSPYVDFFAGPKSYYRYEPGEPGGLLGPAQSVNCKKLWLDELDIRTNLCSTTECVCKNLEETKCVLWREFSKNMAYGSGMWWMDLGDGWFNSPDIMNEISKLEKVRHDLCNRQRKSISEVLLVVDENAFYYSNSESSFHHLLMKEFVREMHLCGVPIDIFRKTDLKTMDLSSYKLIVFLNAFKLSGKEWSEIEKKISSDTTLYWNYYVDNGVKITGIKLLERSSFPDGELIFKDHSKIKYNNMQFPLFEIEKNDGLEILASYSDHGIAVGQKKWNGRNNIFCALPVIKAKQLRLLIENAGCHIYAPFDCTVYADNQFIGVFPRSDIDGKLCLKEALNFVDVETGEYFNQQSFIPLKLKAKRHKVLIKKEQSL